MKDGASEADLRAADSVQRSDFSQTHWTTVLHAQGASPSAHEALNKLCCKYWPPVYAFIRRKWTQHSPHTAEDLTQGFFAEFIRKFPNLEIGPDQGKFRNYLLACLTRFLCKDWDRSPAANERIISPDELERTVATDASTPFQDGTPERVFDFVWATTLVQKTLASLRDEYHGAGKGALHARLLPFLAERTTDGAYVGLAAELQMSEGALRVATHQFRRRFGQLLRTEVSQTVPRPEDTDEELRYLLSLWGANGSSAQSGS
jgi:DNA-directed RNA polymerase specialized sigma24 family protein